MRGITLYLYANRVTHASMQSEETDGIGLEGRGRSLLYMKVFRATVPGSNAQLLEIKQGIKPLIVRK